MTDVSIIVPTRDRPDALARCLAALSAQRDLDALEIIVVDDGSAEVERLAKVVQRFTAARLLRTTGVGPAAARNVGVAASTGQFVCFTDDDCEPASDWAARLVESLVTGADATGGQTVNGLPDDVFVEASELIVRELQDSTLRRLGGHGVFIPTNNLASRREVLHQHPFDEGYSRPAGEDRAWCASVAGVGLQLRLEPRAVVVHRPALGWRQYWRQHVRYGHGAFRFAMRRPNRAWREPPGFYLRLLREALRISPTCLLLVLLAQVATAVGFISEAVRSEGRG
jgi:glycosyltransferase involved in cell wall biosynthesis